MQVSFNYPIYLLVKTVYIYRTIYNIHDQNGSLPLAPSKILFESSGCSGIQSTCPKMK